MIIQWLKAMPHLFVHNKYGDKIASTFTQNVILKFIEKKSICHFRFNVNNCVTLGFRNDLTT